ncbi:DUF4360 domain-containing protein [Streptomyces mobaraensis NBRC 13819 = DSM 40847]|uniref:DUF4360 domain-containing protein n=2 Tax=Streptomyces mobaraensis TaxID=35621 RepID=A0A5N5VY96_STRMB|nr:DUF4360 domain-containing protein [Streptomyces mobaraensis]EMF01562.1 secreted protein [Streptomyces mobaraensis NBRC 13819 = DSM 40847]KAB7833772.1 DUF4360 domain-containing protein [Streptomyces mobaraensis]QTT72180.1 DUF4360 domain-containing protein [Streptomyces mobaraensis NBRC 13819 = DSM 40847]
MRGPTKLRPAVLGGAAAALLTVAAPPAGAAPIGVPPPDKIVIDVVTVNGSGCPAGTANVAVSPDNTAFTVSYSNYTAQVGVGSKPTDARRNCQLSLNVHVPQGFTYAVARADYRGFAHLEKGAAGLERANYYFQGMQQTSFVNHHFTGPLNDNWQTSDTTDIDALVYAPCGAMRYFNINTELRVDAGTSDTSKTSSFLMMDSTDGNISTLYHFAWKQCPAR